MAFIRNCFLIAVTTLCAININAQNISYPPYSSQLLKATAADAAMLFTKALPGNQFTVSQYSGMPQTGIIFNYDSTITGNLACRVESDGINFIKFSAAEDNGLCFGFYQYLQNLGFRFYQPGIIWEIIPTIPSVYKKMDSIYNSAFKYNSWFISSGYGRWAMDTNNDYGWDNYNGDNGHAWALFQRRNGMTGEYRFAGHRGDIMTGNYMTTLRNNPCYVACSNNSRVATSQSVADVNNPAAMNFWATAIEQNYTQHRNTLSINPAAYTNQFRNFKYSYQNIGIEVPDVAQWGNSIDSMGCSNTPYPGVSDQQITLANYTAQKINTVYPDKRFQIYAYSQHADVPSPSIAINSNIDVQLIPAVYQLVTSTNGLRNRWYNRTKNISEYNYLNLTIWTGETPSVYLSDFKATVQIAKDKKSQGLVWETSPTKFISLPYLLAASNDLLHNVPIDESMQEFCDNMFGDAGKTVYDLFQFWTDRKNSAGGSTNKYKISKYLEYMAKADGQTKNAPLVVKERLRELKAYVHYIILYYNWSTDIKPADVKAAQASELCLYLATTNKMQLVNSVKLVNMINAKYAPGSSFREQYNPSNGTAYQNGNLPLITASEIENNFTADLAKYGNSIKGYNFEDASVIKDKMASAGLIPQQKIIVNLGYTNGLNFYNNVEFFVIAPGPGSFSIDYTPVFNMPGAGYINFLVESADKALEVIKDFTIDETAAAGQLNISVPAAGRYKFTVSSLYKSGIHLEINTNKNIFYKGAGFFGKTTETYPNNIGMAGYFYVPENVNRVYFSFGNTYTATNGFASAEKIDAQFGFLDSKEKKLTARFATPNDSALFYIDIPIDSRGKFCRITKKSNYSLIFANISNYYWYAQPKPTACSDANFDVAVVSKKGNCIIELTALNNNGVFDWMVEDANKTYTFSNQRVVDLPDFISPKAVVTLSNGSTCSVSKKLQDETDYKKGMESCVAAGPVPEITLRPVMAPNPSTGNFACMQNAVALLADDIIIYNGQGIVVAEFKKVSRFNIGSLPAGIYWYKMMIKQANFSGKLVKL